MQLRSLLAVGIILSGIALIYYHQNNVLHSEIVSDESSLDFYLADSYKLIWAETVFRYDTRQKPYDKQLQ